ncbi:hypothetical protein MHYP_G00230950 [Metynnis hypsauchen]
MKCLAVKPRGGEAELSRVMEIQAEADVAERRREHWKLLSNLKTTVEGLLSTNNPNVWSRYGGSAATPQGHEQHPEPRPQTRTGVL